MTAPHLIRVTFRGYTLGGAGADIGVTGIDGWIGTAGAQTSSDQGNVGHGSLPAPNRQGRRTVVVSGLIRDTNRRDEVLDRLESLFAVADADDDSVERLDVEMAGRSRYAWAQLLDWQPNTDVKLWAAGFTAVRLTLLCPDPRVFSERITATAPLAVPSAAVTVTDTLAVPFDLPAEPIGGTVTIVNPGTARSGSDVTVTLTGEQVGGVGVLHVTTSAAQLYDLELEATDVLEFSTEDGTTLNGEQRQAVHPSRPAQKLRARPGLNEYSALGQAGAAGAPTIRVDIDPAYL